MSSKDLGEPTLPPCRVCGRRASGLHFGVITCEACKAFYKRSRGRERPFVCRGKESGKCVIKNGKTPLCSFCRLQLCLKVGMCREGINKGRCPIEKKAELLLEAREHQQDMMRQKLLNERRGLQTKQQVSAEEKTGKSSISGIETTMHRSQEPLQEFHLNPNQPKPIQPSLYQHQVILDNPLTAEVMMGGTVPLQPSGINPQESQEYGEFMNLLMTEDPLEVDQVGILDATETAYSFSGERLMEIIGWLDSVIQADIETQLYDDEETEQAVMNNATYKATQAVKEELLGPLKPLSHEIYTEVYTATGIDVDDYRLKPSECIMESDQDIYNFIEFLVRVPIFADHDLNDRLRIAKGGFLGWMLLSSLEVYDSEGDCISCCNDDGLVWTGEDFVQYFGPSFEGALKNTLEVFQNAGLTQEEVAVLKMRIIYKDRPYLEPKGSGNKIKEQQDLINDSLIYLFEANRGKDKAKETLEEVMKAMDLVEKIGAAVSTNARQWPTKFPELAYPRIWLEMSSLVPEEELIVAVSANLRISD